MAKRVTIEVTSNGAVYVNNSRITGRDTKWGIQQTVFTTKCLATQVSKTLADNGYGHIKLDAEYATEAGVV